MDNNYHNLIEALLLSADGPLSLEKIREVLILIEPEEINKIIEELNQKYTENGHSFKIREIAGGFQVYTLPEYAPWIEKLWERTRFQRLSKAALETLAIVAYKQPIVKAEIDRIRGVQSDSALKTLLERNLIAIAGREKAPGRPLLYQNTEKFLSHFGLNNLKELPQLEELKTILEAEIIPQPIKEVADLKTILEPSLPLEVAENPTPVVNPTESEV